MSDSIEIDVPRLFVGRNVHTTLRSKATSVIEGIERWDGAAVIRDNCIGLGAVETETIRVEQ